MLPQKRNAKAEHFINIKLTRAKHTTNKKEQQEYYVCILG